MFIFCLAKYHLCILEVVPSHRVSVRVLFQWMELFVKTDERSQIALAVAIGNVCKKHRALLELVSDPVEYELMVMTELESENSPFIYDQYEETNLISYSQIESRLIPFKISMSPSR